MRRNTQQNVKEHDVNIEKNFDGFPTQNFKVKITATNQTQAIPLNDDANHYVTTK